MLTGTEAQQQRLHDGDVGLLEEIEDAHFLAVERVLEARRDVGDFGEEDREQEDMRDIDLPDPAQDARRRNHEADLQHRAAVDEGRRIAGDEDEDFGGVGKAVVADGEPGQNVGRQMIDEDQPQREPAEQVEAQFALARHRHRDGGRIGRGHGGARSRGFGMLWRGYGIGD